MSTEEESAPAALPPYSDLILEAIDGLKEKDGSSQAAISNYIESHHENLPQDHADQLSEYLKKLNDSGALATVNDNYKRPDPAAPAKRGRGRPPKPKAPLPPGYVPPPPRPRGRPPKYKDSAAGGGAAAALKPRGRVSKKPSTKAKPPATAAAAAGVKRGRGRPPKAKPAVAAVGA